jgi:hypothetical protein
VSLERLLLTACTLAFAALCYALMLKGWRSRQRRQRDLPAPPVARTPRTDVVVDAVPGLYVGTTSATDWLDRVAVHGLGDRASGRLTVAGDGVHVERQGLPPLYLPFSSIRCAGVGEALAGKVIGKGGLLLVSWQLGDQALTSGFRADDHDLHPRLAEAISARLTIEPAQNREAS